jgi:hypothetical protein
LYANTTCWPYPTSDIDFATKKLSWLSVLAVLTIEFARTIAMALSIGDFAHKFMNRWVAPIMERATPKQYSVSKSLDCLMRAF